MTANLALTVTLAVLIGVSLGLLGGGGSILAVPLLLHVTGLPAKEAIATSLLVVGVTSAVGVIPHVRANRVRWRTALVFGLAGMAGAYTGGRLAEFIPTRALLTGFALMMVATAIAMICRRPTASGPPVRREPPVQQEPPVRREPPVQQEPPVRRELPVPRVVLDGALVGLVTGLVGAGGGFLVVPALVLLGGLPMPIAVGTSLVVIAMKSLAGLAGYLASVHIDWGLAAVVTLAAVAGSLAGGRLAGRIPADALRTAFGWFIVVMGIFVLGQQLPEQLRADPLLWAGASGAAIAVAVTCRMAGTGRNGGRGDRAPRRSLSGLRPRRYPAADGGTG